MKDTWTVNFHAACLIFGWLSHSKYCSLRYIKIKMSIFAMNCTCEQTFHLLKKKSNIRVQMSHIWVELCILQLPQLFHILVSLTTATSTTWHTNLVSTGNLSYIYINLIVKTNLNYYIFFFPACQNTFNLQSWRWFDSMSTLQLYIIKNISFGGYAKESSKTCTCEGNENVINVSRVKLAKFSAMKPPSIILLCVVFPQ